MSANGPNHYVVRDANKQLAYVYYENEPGRLSAAKLVTKDEARRMGRTSPGCRELSSRDVPQTENDLGKVEKMPRSISSPLSCA